MKDPFSPKQIEFIRNSNAKINLAHGSVRSGKTVCTLFRFLQAAHDCPGDSIWMIGHTVTSVFHNVIALIFNAEELQVFRPFSTWQPGNKVLLFGTKKIHCLGAADEGAIGNIQGKTFDLVYCDEMTLYPDTIIDMIQTRLSRDHSQLFASMNPKHPTHKIKQWIDKAEAGDKEYYSLHFAVDDNPYLSESYKKMIRESVSGLFYKRNYLGIWCLAEGAVFDFFDKSIHVVKKPPRAAEYWIAGVDYGTSNAFACVIVGVSTGKYTQTGKCLWVEKEYYWDSKKQNRQKTNAEYANDVQEFLEPYDVKALYIDPSAASFKEELRRRRIRCVDANNDVEYGIHKMTSEMSQGNLFVLNSCINLIREIESYVWDPKKSEKGEDAPLKKDDHAVDALRYAISSHKVASFDADNYYKKKEDEWKQQNWPQGNGFRPYYG